MRLIDADALYKILSDEAAHKILHSNGSQFDVGRTNGIICARDIMTRHAPTIEPKRGAWIEREDEMRCPICHVAWNYYDNDTHRFEFCPNCGADMRTET